MGRRGLGEIQTEVLTNNANVSQHLSILRKQGAIVSRKKANYIYNRIADKRVAELVNTG
jgi:ArsR family transcriptional regulator